MEADGEEDGQIFEVLEYIWHTVLFLIRTTVVASVITFAAWLYCRVSQGKCKCMNRLDGKTVLITGGSTGIGYETARTLAARGARVIITCRDMEVGETALKKIISVTGNPNVALKYLDFCSLGCVKRFAEDILSTEEELHILINNAGRAGDFIVTSLASMMTPRIADSSNSTSRYIIGFGRHFGRLHTSTVFSFPFFATSQASAGVKLG